jgi:hypothetical protein
VKILHGLIFDYLYSMGGMYFLYGGLLGLFAGIVTGYLVFKKKTETPDLDSIHLKLDNIMATQAQLAQELRDVKAQNDKSRAEILAKIAALEEAIANGGGTTPEVDEALADLKASVQTDDDIVPDAPPVEPV